MSSRNPEIGRLVPTGALRTNVRHRGRRGDEADVVLLLHGSGPGVSAWAN
ncbi:hypothetical protein [Marihabitans asiaticum]|nr:hypothetical protein [Marihabitans asiaticum]